MLRLFAIDRLVILECVLVAVNTVPFLIVIAEGKSVLRRDAVRLPFKAELRSLGGVDLPLTDGGGFLPLIVLPIPLPGWSMMLTVQCKSQPLVRRPPTVMLM